jgi:hypothetical protein
MQLLFWSSGYTQPSCDWQQLHYYADNNLSSSRDQAPLLSVECSTPPFLSCSLCKHTHQISEGVGGTEVLCCREFHIKLLFLSGVSTVKIILKLKNRVVPIFTTSFNLQKNWILPTQCIYVFRIVLTMKSDYFPKQH